MSALELHAASLTGSLWPSGRPSIRASDGAVFEMLWAEGTPIHFTCAAFAEHNEQRVCVGTSSGSAFLIDLKKNRYALIAQLSGAAVSAVTFCRADSSLLAVASATSVLLVDIDRASPIGKLFGVHTSTIRHVVGADRSAMLTLATLSDDAFAVWSLTSEKPVMSLAKRGYVAVTLADAMAFLVDHHGVVSSYDVTSQTKIGAVTTPGYTPTTITHVRGFPGVLALGTEQGAIVLMTYQLSGVRAVSVPSRDPVRSVRCAGANMTATLTADGAMSFVVHDAASSRLSFELPKMNKAKETVRALEASTVRYGLAVTNRRAVLFHLPTAKSAFDRIWASPSSTMHGVEDGGATTAPSTTGAVAGEPMIPVPTPSFAVRHIDNAGDGPNFASVLQGALPATSPTSDCTAPVPKPTLKPPSDDKARSWMKVNLLSSAEGHVAATSARMPTLLTARDAVQRAFGAQESVNASDASHKRETLMRPAKAKGRPQSATTTGPKNPIRSSAAASSEKPSSPEELLAFESVISVRGWLDAASRKANLSKLRYLLLQHGAFPERYRPVIYRFLLQLPDRNSLAPQFVLLMNRGSHPGAVQLMRPFPLPDNRLRLLFEKVLSALAHHAPAFAVAHFMPNLVFPFVSVFNADIQSCVEVVLSFLQNWGREFFKFYPHYPVNLVSLVNHLLKLEDPDLHRHLTNKAVGPDIYVWEVMSSLYSDVLTRAEWLQVMDHTLANEPIWLILFHVNWLIQLREVLLSVETDGVLQSCFKRATPFDINVAIQQTYRLQTRYFKTELSAPYESFEVFPTLGGGDATGVKPSLSTSGAPIQHMYPSRFEAHESVVTSMLGELRAIDEHESHLKRVHRTNAEIERRLAHAALMEEAMVGNQRAMVAAKYDAAQSLWRQKVLLQKDEERLREIEHEARLQAVEQQIRTADRLEALHEELQCAVATEEHNAIDREREAMTWRYAGKFTAHEVDRIEEAARVRLAHVMRGNDIAGGPNSGGGPEGMNVSPMFYFPPDSSRSHLPPAMTRQDTTTPMAPGDTSGVLEPPSSFAVSPAAPHTTNSSAVASDVVPPLDDGLPAAALRQAVSPAAHVVTQSDAPEPRSSTPQPTPPRHQEAVITDPHRKRPPLGPREPSSAGSDAATTPTTNTPSVGTTATTTSTTVTSIASDPVAALARLNLDIRQRVELAARERAAMLDAIRSQFASSNQALFQATARTAGSSNRAGGAVADARRRDDDADDSTTSSVVSSTDTTVTEGADVYEEEPLEGTLPQYFATGRNGTAAPHAGRNDLSTSSSSATDEPTTAETTTTSIDDEDASTVGETMTEAIMRPHDAYRPFRVPPATIL